MSSDVPQINRGVVDSSNFLERNIVARLVRPPDYKIPAVPPAEDTNYRWFKPFIEQDASKKVKHQPHSLPHVDAVSTMLTAAVEDVDGVWAATYQKNSVDEVTVDDPDGPGDVTVQVNSNHGAYFRALQESTLYGQVWARNLDRDETGNYKESFNDKYAEIPSAIYIESARRFISTPYIAKDPRKYQNGLEGYGNLFKDSVLYLWRVRENAEGETPVVNLGMSSNDITLRVAPQDVMAKVPYKPLQLYPESFDPNVPKNAKGPNSIGAFMLRMSVQKGVGPKRGRPWTIAIKFGEVNITLQEDTSVLKVRYDSSSIGRGSTRTVEFPDLGTRLMEDFGDRSMALTFIPVWGGLLISDLPPSDISESSDRVKFVSNFGNTVEDYVGGINNDPERFRRTNKKKKDPKYPIKLPALNRKGNRLRFFSVTDPEGSKDPVSRDFFGYRVDYEKDYPELDTKSPLEVTYHNCGGQLQFVPVYFAPNVRLHRFEYGEPQDQIKDIHQLELPPCSGKVRIVDPGTSGYEAGEIISKADFDAAVESAQGRPDRTAPTGVVGTSDDDCDDGTYTSTSWAEAMRDAGKKAVDEMPIAQSCRVLAITHWPTRNGIIQKSRAYALPGSSEAINDVVLDIRRKGWVGLQHEQNPPDPAEPEPTEDDPEDEVEDRVIKPVFVRLPVEIFGYMLYKYTPVAEDPNKEKAKNQKGRLFTLRNGERVLSLNDIPENRIRSIQVSRNLDGSSGSIVWDRYDPLTGLYPRPNQFVGSVSLAVQGGNDIVPGVFWTGIAMGNAVVNNENANEVRTTLFGRETKLADGGIHIINAPYFDGWDHVEVLEWLGGYAGFPIRNLAAPYTLPASGVVNSRSYIVDFGSGTPVIDAITEICKLSGTQGYFDRFGRFVYLEQNRHTGVNWEYPETQVESYDDDPDLSQIRNSLVITGLYHPQGDYTQARTLMLGFRLNTYPEFEFDKMMHYAINAIFTSKAEFNRAAIRIARQVSRPRATGAVTIPGNSKIELLDTFNTNWLVVNISHSVDTQGKTYRTSLSLEYLLQGDVTGQAAYLPLPVVT